MIDDNWTTPYTIRMRRVRDGLERDIPKRSSSDPDAVDYVLTDGHWGDPNNRALLFGDPTPEPPLDDDAREYVIVRVTREDGTVVMEGDPTVDEPPNSDGGGRGVD